jgi:MipA family protein
MCITPASAQSVDAGNSSQWGLGFGAGMDFKPYRDFDDQVQAGPLVMFENKWLSILLPRVDLRLLSAGPVQFRMRLRYDPREGYEADDSPHLRGMEDRDKSAWAGVAALWRNDFVNVSAEVLTDVFANSEGTKARLQLDRSFQWGAFDFTPRLAAVWGDDKYVDYYYGVTPAEARADRAAYVGESSVNLEAGLRIGYAITPKQSAFVDLSGVSLDKSIEESPLVERATQSTVGIGYLYRF